MKASVPISLAVRYKKVELWPFAPEDTIGVFVMVLSCVCFVLGFWCAQVTR